MSPLHIRGTALKAGAKVVTTAASALYHAAGAHDTSDEEVMPPLLRYFSESIPSLPTDSEDDLTAPRFFDDEAQAAIARAEQWRAWFQEDSDRESDLDSIRSSDSSSWPPPMGLLGQPAYPPPQDVRKRAEFVFPARYPRAQAVSVHDVSELSMSSDYEGQPSQSRRKSAPALPPPTYEQQTGIVRDQPALSALIRPPAAHREYPIFSAEELSDLLVAVADCLLKRQNAVRRTSNPLFARPKAKDFRGARKSW
jgi:hypothetical protein